MSWRVTSRAPLNSRPPSTSHPVEMPEEASHHTSFA